MSTATSRRVCWGLPVSKGELVTLTVASTATGKTLGSSWELQAYLHVGGRDRRLRMAPALTLQEHTSSVKATLPNSSTNGGGCQVFKYKSPWKLLLFKPPYQMCLGLCHVDNKQNKTNKQLNQYNQATEIHHCLDLGLWSLFHKLSSLCWFSIKSWVGLWYTCQGTLFHHQGSDFLVTPGSLNGERC